MVAARCVRLTKVKECATHGKQAAEREAGLCNRVGGGRPWTVKTSCGSHDCINPIRQFEEVAFRDALDNRRTDIEFIKLSLGDTTALQVHPAVPHAVRHVLASFPGLRRKREAWYTLHWCLCACVYIPRFWGIRLSQ